MLFAYPLIADDNADKVILPETPPTIEYYRKTTLDKPVLQRLNFITDPEINSLPEVSVADFKDFHKETFPVYIGMGFGSFGTVDGSFLFTSSDSWHLGYKTYYTDGEIQQLKHRENVFDWAGDTFLSDNFNVSGNVLSDEKLIWSRVRIFMTRARALPGICARI